jgi:hypothetical protein
LHFDNLSELPVFNLMKLHGSLTWIMENEKTIVFSSDLAHVDIRSQIARGSAGA